MSLYSELKRRNVFRVAIAYLAGAWLLTEVAGTLFPAFGVPDWAIRFIVIVFALGFVPALVFSWAYEITPGGIKREKDVVRDASITNLTAKRLDSITIGLIILALAFITVDRLWLGSGLTERTSIQTELDGGKVVDEPEPVDESPVIAVLPFKAAGSEDSGFLAGGLHDDLLTRLAKLGAFRVISRTSMMEYAGSTKNMRQIGEELGASYILEGGVQAMGKRVRINAQLINANADEHLWAETYDHELTTENLFDIQAKLAIAIAKALQVELSPTDLALMNKVPTENMAAYKAYLSGLQHFDSTGYIGMQKDRQAVEDFENAVRLDPDFALAWANLATARIRANCCTFTQDQSKAILTALAKARILQPGLIEAELAWVEYLYRVTKEYSQALESLEVLGERIAGNRNALQLKAWLNRRLGQFDVAYQDLLAAKQLEPRNPSIYINLIRYAWLTNDCGAAGRYAEQLMSLAPEAPGPKVRLAHYELECTGNAELAADLVRDVDFSNTGGLNVALMAAWQAGDTKLYLSLNNTEFANPNPFQQIWQQLNLAALYVVIEPNETLSGRALGSVAELLNTYDNNPLFAQGSQFAFLKAYYHSMTRDAAKTREWIEEHKRRFREEEKNDIAQEALNRYNYAWFYTLAGLLNEAVEELRIMLVEPGGHRFLFIDSDPTFDILGNHAGYIALLEKFGN